ncbi:MAG: hypothetical protein ACREBR_02135 [bacterium]
MVLDGPEHNRSIRSSIKPNKIGYWALRFQHPRMTDLINRSCRSLHLTDLIKREHPINYWALRLEFVYVNT